MGEGSQDGTRDGETRKARPPRPSDARPADTTAGGGDAICYTDPVATPSDNDRPVAPAYADTMYSAMKNISPASAFIRLPCATRGAAAFFSSPPIHDFWAYLNPRPPSPMAARWLR